MINLNCHIYRCGPNENCGLSDEDFRDTDKPTLQEPVKDPARLEWHEVKKVAHYYLSVNALVSITLMTAESRPVEKDVMVSLIVNLINKSN